MLKVKPISKQQWVDAIRSIELQLAKDEQWYNLTKQFNPLGEGMFYDNDTVVTGLIKLLESFTPHPEAEWVSWFVYENDFGKRKLTIDKTAIYTAGDLYDAIFS